MLCGLGAPVSPACPPRVPPAHTARALTQGACATPTGVSEGSCCKRWLPPCLPSAHSTRAHTRLWGWQTPLRLPWLLLRLALKPPLVLLHTVARPLHLRAPCRLPRPPSEDFSEPHVPSPPSPQPWLPPETAAQLLALKSHPFGSGAVPRLQLSMRSLGCSSPQQQQQQQQQQSPPNQDCIAAVHQQQRARRPLDFREAAEEGYFTPPGSPGSAASLQSGQRGPSTPQQVTASKVDVLAMSVDTAQQCPGLKHGQLPGSRWASARWPPWRHFQLALL